MKQLTKISVLAIVLISIGFIGCKKEIGEYLPNNNTQEDSLPLTISGIPKVKVENGMLSFENKEQFFKTINILSKASYKEIQNWESAIGFESLYTIQQDALSELDSNSTEANLQIWLKKHRNLFKKMMNKDKEEEIVPINDSYVYALICNRNNIYKIESNIYYISKNKVTIIPASNIKSENLQEISRNKKNYISFDIENNKSVKYDKPTRHIAIAIRDERGCRNDRKVKIENTLVYYYIYNNGVFYYNITVNTEVKGYTKLSCIWRSYNTTLQYRNVKGEVYYNNANSYKSFYIGARISYSNTRSLTGSSLIKSGTTTSSSTLVNMLSNVYFKKDYGEATSRGVGNLWAVIKYNY